MYWYAASGMDRKAPAQNACRSFFVVRTDRTHSEVSQGFFVSRWFVSYAFVAAVHVQVSYFQGAKLHVHPVQRSPPADAEPKHGERTYEHSNCCTLATARSTYYRPRTERWQHIFRVALYILRS